MRHWRWFRLIVIWLSFRIEDLNRWIVEEFLYHDTVTFRLVEPEDSDANEHNNCIH